LARRLGLIIGINQYQDTAFRPLQFAETDAKALAQWLVNVRGGKWLPSDVQLVLGSQATRELTESLLTQVCLNEAMPGDLILIYFAGHAFVDQSSKEGYLALANTRYQQPDTGLHLYSLVRNIIAASRAAQILLVLDCFQSGPAWNSLRASPFDFKPLLGQSLLNGLQQIQGRLLYCSCRGNESVPEVGGKNLGVLMHSAIVGLSGPAVDPATGQVTLQRLHAFLSSSLNPQYSPQVFGQEQRPIVLVGDLPTLTGSKQNGYESAAVPPASPAGTTPFQASTSSPWQQSPQNTASTATATRQMSPTTSGQLALSVLERNRQQQCMMLLNQARQLVQMQNLTEALTIVNQVLQISPTLSDALILKGQILGTAGQFQDALAAIKQSLQSEPNNALGWSMQAALLANLGEFQEALTSVERSLAIDPNNPETWAVKETILTRQQLVEQSQKLQAAYARPRDNAASFLLSAFLQIFALIVGSIGISLLLIAPQLAIIIAFVLGSLGLSVLCVNAARGAYLYGFSRLLITLITSLMAAGIIGALYKFGYNWIVNRVTANPPLIVSVIFLGTWLLVAAIVPFLAGIGGLIAGLFTGVRRKK